MSIEVLYSAENGDIRQKPCHDLESIFYVILYICTFFDGPGVKGYREVESIPMKFWFEGDMTFHAMGDMKFGQISHFEERFVSNIQPYFKDLISCLRAIFNGLFPPSSDGHRNLGKCVGTHDDMIAALRTAYDSLPGSDPPQPGPDGNILRALKPTKPTGSSRQLRSATRKSGGTFKDTGPGATNSGFQLRSATKRRSEDLIHISQSPGPSSSGSKRTRHS
jgi:hypothetical protein